MVTFPYLLPYVKHATLMADKYDQQLDTQNKHKKFSNKSTEPCDLLSYFSTDTLFGCLYCFPHFALSYGKVTESANMSIIVSRNQIACIQCKSISDLNFETEESIK